MSKYNIIGKRIGAGIIDGLVFLPFSFTDALVLSSTFFFILFSTLYLLLWSIYTVSLHHFYGQTLGKKIMGIKLYNIDENSLIPLKKAFQRESIWIVGQLIILIFFVAKILATEVNKEELINNHEGSAALLTISWTVIELITMLTNVKRRSIQDYIANSIVIKIN